MATARRNMRDMSRLGLQRGCIYGFLATIYRKELTPEVLNTLRNSEFLEALVGIGILLKDELSGGPSKRILEDLEAEYARLFLGPGRHISPHESVHFEEDDRRWDSLWGESSVEVKHLIESLGLRFKEGGTTIPDHISAEMELMQEIITRETKAWRRRDKEGALSCLALEKRLLEDRLCKWIPQFCRQVTAQAENPFHKGVAKLTMDFVEFERESLDSYVNM